MKKLILALVALLLPVAANAATIVNGSFEDSPFSPGSFVTFGPGNGLITGWTIGGENVDYIGSYWEASDGARSVDLNGGGPGSLSQTFDTVAGRAYTVTFDLAGNPDIGAELKLLTVTAANDSADYSFDTTGASRADMNWSNRTFAFTATGASTTLTFSSAMPGAYGPALDNVAIAAVPEPATWAMMIGGIGFAGGALRTRRRSAAFA